MAVKFSYVLRGELELIDLFLLLLEMETKTNWITHISYLFFAWKQGALLLDITIPLHCLVLFIPTSF